MFVNSAAADTLADLGLVGPETNLVGRFPSEDDGQRGSPGPGSDDGNAARACGHWRDAPRVSDCVRVFEPILDSVPDMSRPMFWRCFQITSKETRAIKINCSESVYSWNAH